MLMRKKKKKKKKSWIPPCYLDLHQKLMGSTLCPDPSSIQVINSLVVLVFRCRVSAVLLYIGSFHHCRIRTANCCDFVWWRLQKKACRNIFVCNILRDRHNIRHSIFTIFMRHTTALIKGSLYGYREEIFQYLQY